MIGYHRASHFLEISMKSALLSLALVAFAPLAFAQKPAQPATAKPAVAKTPAAVASTLPTKAVLHTSQGDITIQLEVEKSPISVANFVQYAKDGFYNGTVFHRVIPGFMIQGGGLDKNYAEKKATHPPIKNEANNGLHNLKFTVSMATLVVGGAVDPQSARSQFFINLADNKRLDYVSDKTPTSWGYAVFAKVIKGGDVVDKIAALPTGPAGPLASDVPTTQVTIDKVDLLP
jgi:peptidyl-prolyl cis-trans isomerase A (cyclophilin A)